MNAAYAAAADPAAPAYVVPTNPRGGPPVDAVWQTLEHLERVTFPPPHATFILHSSFPAMGRPKKEDQVWKDDDLERLIEQYRARPALWDKSSQASKVIGRPLLKCVCTC